MGDNEKQAARRVNACDLGKFTLFNVLVDITIQVKTGKTAPKIWFLILKMSNKRKTNEVHVSF